MTDFSPEATGTTVGLPPPMTLPPRFHAGQRVQAHKVRGGEEWTLSEEDAATLNRGDNPLHPWRVRGFEIVQEAP